jgi:hypothetical protein
MDSDDEEEQMFAELFEEEMAAAQDEEHMLILACLSGLYAEKAIANLSNYLLVLLNYNIYL